MDAVPQSAWERAEAGRGFCRRFEFVAGQKAWEEALTLLVQVSNEEAQPDGLRALLHGEWLAQWALCAKEAGHVEHARERLAAELQAWSVRDVDGIGPGDAARERANLVRAELTCELASCMLILLQVQGAIAQAQTALALLPATGETLLRARVLGVQGRALSTANDRPAAAALVQGALRLFDEAADPGWQLEVGELHGVLAATHGAMGLHDLAQADFDRAETMLAGIAATGSIAALGRLGRVRMNRGAICTILGRYDEAVAHVRSALTAIDSTVRRSPRGTDLRRMRMTRLIALMNLGYALFEAGLDEEAARQLRLACRLGARLVKTQPHVEAQRHRCLVNLAHVLVRQGRWVAATRLYERGHVAFAKAVDDGRTHLLSDRLNAALCLARVLLLRGRVEASCGLFSETMATLTRQTRDGSLYNAAAWLQAWQQQMDAALQPTSAGAHPSPAALQALLDVMSDAPRQVLGPADSAPSMLLRAVRCLAGWVGDVTRGQAAAAAAPALPVLRAHLRLLLSSTADVLADFEPTRLQAHAPALQDALAQLRDLAARLPDAAEMLADWFLHTHGLRAQRNALAQCSEPELRVLQDRLSRLRRVEDELLGAFRPVDTAARTTVPLTAVASVAPVPRPPEGIDRLVEEWRTLQEDCRRLREDAVARRLLPPVLRLDNHAVASGLRPGSALLMMVVAAPGQVLVVALRGGGGRPSMAVTELSATARAFSPRLLNTLACRAVAAQCTGRAVRGAPSEARHRQTVVMPDVCAADGDRFALEVAQQIWVTALLPTLQRLAAGGVCDVSLVPGDDLHLLPWGHFAAVAAPDGLRMDLYPSAGSWAQCRLDPGEEAGPRTEPRPRDTWGWALAACPALHGQRPLPWAEVEVALARLLWADARGSNWTLLTGPAPQAAGVDGLLAVGHGAVPQDNPARAGLALEDGVVLTGHDLQRVRICRLALVSACVLGATDEVFGEALGFMSSCFDFGTRFGVSWLTDVPDADACLASLALQFIVRNDASGRSWSRAVVTLRRCLGDGVWPAGFGGWLREHLPQAARAMGPRWRHELALAHDPSTGDRPPPSLQRLIPWMVALGR